MKSFALRKAHWVALAAIMTLLFCTVFFGCTQAGQTAAQAPTGTYTLPKHETNKLKREINAIMQRKLSALKQKDYDLYLSTVTQNDVYYWNEQARWYSEMVNPVISDLSFEVTNITPLDETSLEAEIHQRHTGNGEQFDFRYPLLFQLEGDSWKDCGYHFELLEKPDYTLKYMPGETRVDDFAAMIDTAYQNLEPVFAEKADDHFEIKLFWDQEMLRQRTIPSVSWLFTGWGGPNESLKLYTGQPDIRSYQGTIQHELVHHITIKICQNNLSDWLLEGTAVYYGNAYYDYSLSNALAHMKLRNMAQSIDHLNQTDMINPSTQQEVWDWYNTGFSYVTYLIETYGHDQFMELFYEAGKKPFNDSVTNENFKQDNIATTSAALETVFGMTPEQLSENYLVWLETADFDTAG